MPQSAADQPGDIVPASFTDHTADFLASADQTLSLEAVQRMEREQDSRVATLVTQSMITPKNVAASEDSTRLQAEIDAIRQELAQAQIVSDQLDADEAQLVRLESQIDPALVFFALNYMVQPSRRALLNAEAARVDQTARSPVQAAVSARGRSTRRADRAGRGEVTRSRRRRARRARRTSRSPRGTRRPTARRSGHGQPPMRPTPTAN